jgi:hypothetical protein
LTAAGSTTLPLAALTGGATVRPHIYEIGVFNTSAVAVALKLVRITTAGTPGATLTSANVSDPEGPASIAVMKNTYSVTATMTDLGYRCQLGAAVGVHIHSADDPRLSPPARPRVGKRHRAGVPILVLVGVPAT